MVCQPFLIGVVPRFQITVFVKEFKRETRSYPKFDPEIAKFPKFPKSEFPYLGQFMPHITDFVKNLQRKATLSKISSSVKKLRSQSILQSWFVNPFWLVWKSKFFNWGHFEADITDFVKNLWREMTSSQNWSLGSEHRLGHGHSPCKYWCFCMRVAENLVNIDVFARRLQKTL